MISLAGDVTDRCVSSEISAIACIDESRGIKSHTGCKPGIGIGGAKRKSGNDVHAGKVRGRVKAGLELI